MAKTLRRSEDDCKIRWNLIRSSPADVPPDSPNAGRDRAGGPSRTCGPQPQETQTMNYANGKSTVQVPSAEMIDLLAIVILCLPFFMILPSLIF